MKFNGGILSAAAVLVFLTAGCEGGGGDGTAGSDYGDNDPGLVACMGDSITSGYDCVGDPYPERLSRLTGKRVLNYGVGGVTSSYGVDIISSVVARKPAYVCILYGANDAIAGRSFDDMKENLRLIIAVCRVNSCIPIIATTPPMNGIHKIFNGRATSVAEAVRALADEEGVALVDLNAAFGDGGLYLNPDDGLHLNDAGGEFIAQQFARKIP